MKHPEEMRPFMRPTAGSVNDHPYITDHGKPYTNTARTTAGLIRPHVSMCTGCHLDGYYACRACYLREEVTA